MLKYDELGIIPNNKIEHYISNDILSVIKLGIDTNKVIDIVNSYSLIDNRFLLYLFIEQCNDLEIKNYLLNRFSKEELLNDIINIKNKYYNIILKDIIKKYKSINQNISESIISIEDNIILKKSLIELEDNYFDNYSEFEYFENEYLRIMGLNDNVNIINGFINCPYSYNQDIINYDKELDSIIVSALKNKIKIDFANIHFMFNRIVSSKDWIDISEDIKYKVMSEIELFSKKYNIIYSVNNMDIFSKSKCKMLNNMYKKI